MNRTRLKEAEELFLMRYPGGFSNPAMLEIAKKHRVEKMNKLVQESFKKNQFKDSIQIVDAMGKVIGQSSLISVFEKPRFRDLIKGLNSDEKERLSHGLKEFLHGDQEFGFHMMNTLLGEYKMAKWTYLTLIPNYYRPDVEVFLKPNTVKGVIANFDLEGLKYSPKPSFDFYKAYREQINQMKREVSASMQVNNAAFCGFLMMSMENNPQQPT
ncbi:MAG: hypothetical protein ABRQ26_10510 [Syntrophomonadaceae bacterium]